MIIQVNEELLFTLKKTPSEILDVRWENMSIGSILGRRLGLKYGLTVDGERIRRATYKDLCLALFKRATEP